MLTINDVNAMTCKQFIECFLDIAEHSSWVSKKAEMARPFATFEDVVKAFSDALLTSTKEDQLALIRAHPDLGNRAALVIDSNLSQDSRKEQTGIGLDQLTEEEYKIFNELNDRYKQQYHFPFILAIKGASKHIILTMFNRRLENSYQAEFDEALKQIGLIFKFRLEDKILS